jgi:hypothetical protein
MQPLPQGSLLQRGVPEGPLEERPQGHLLPYHGVALLPSVGQILTADNRVGLHTPSSAISVWLLACRENQARGSFQRDGFQRAVPGIRLQQPACSRSHGLWKLAMSGIVFDCLLVFDAVPTNPHDSAQEANRLGDATGITLSCIGQKKLNGLRMEEAA